MTKEEEIQEIERGVKKYAPVVAEFFDRTDSVADFAKTLHDAPLDDVQRDRQKKIIGIIQAWLAPLFSNAHTMTPPLAMNIVDHHAVLNHPILLATNIIANAHTLLSEERKPPITVFTSAVVPPNNFFNKKGFLFHGKRVPLFSNSEMHMASCCIPVRDLRFTAQMKTTGAWKNFDSHEQAFLSELENDFVSLGSEHDRNYMDQVSRINAYLWKRLFAPELRDRIPDLHYVPQEEVLKDLLPELLEDTSSLPYRMLFDNSLREAILSAFRGCTGCWDEEHQKGTHFFWHRTASLETERLFLENGKLVSPDHSFSCQFDAQHILPLVSSGELIPNLFVIFACSVFWAGMRPLVGYGSCNYLTRMKDTWMKILSSSKAKDEYDRVVRIDTKGLVGGTIVTYTRNESGDISNEYMLDVIARGGLSSDYIQQLVSLSYAEILRPALLEIYESYVPVSERQKVTLTVRDMLGPGLEKLLSQ